MPTFRLRIGDALYFRDDVSWDNISYLKSIAKELGARWDSYNREWYIPFSKLLFIDPEAIADKIVEMFPDKTREEVIEKILAEKRKAEEKLKKRARNLPKATGVGEKLVYVVFPSSYIGDRDLYYTLKNSGVQQASGVWQVSVGDLVEYLAKKGVSVDWFLDKIKEAKGRIIGEGDVKSLLEEEYETYKKIHKPTVVITGEDDKGRVILKLKNTELNNQILDDLKDYRAMTYRLRAKVDKYGVPQYREVKLSLLVPYYRENELHVDPAILKKVLDYFRDKGFKVEATKEYESYINPPVKQYEWEFKGKLRDYQEEALKAWKENGYRGTIVIPTGGGKTVIALKAIADLGVPTVIVVPSEELVNQWAEKIKKFLGVEAGKYYGKEKDLKPITITTYNTFGAHPEVFKDYLFVIADEGHRAPANSFKEGFRKVPAPYRMALTATPDRDDGNEDLLYKTVGRIVYEVPLIDLAEKGYLAPVLTEYIRVPLTPEEEEEYNRLMEQWRYEREIKGIGAMGLKNKARRIAETSVNKTRYVEEIVDKYLGKPNSDDKIIIFVNYIPQGKEIYERLKKKYGDIVAYVSSKVSTKKRKQEFDAFRKGKKRILIVTQLGDEGIDIPDANVGIIASFYSTIRRMIQRIGRTIRPKENKVANVYVIYTDPEERKANELIQAWERIAPSDRMKKLVDKIATRIHKKLLEKKDLIAEAPEEIKKILTKTAKQLTDEEKKMLLEYVLQKYGSYRISQDVARASKKKARYVYSWLKNPSKKDLPGVDTPEMKKVLRKMKRKLKNKS